ncbi:MetS family NSS transporter small subunit [Desulfoplanes formicivorans]|nr:MetS family NSS transporter small subunit [Desulfoplanes formicivorans]
MSTSAVIMLIFGLTITWGGAAVCISKAMKKS